MAFDDVCTRRHRKLFVEAVTASYYPKLPRLSVVVSGPLMARLGWDLLATRVLVAEGSGADHGWLRFRPVEAGGLALTRNGATGLSGVISIHATTLRRVRFRTDPAPPRRVPLPYAVDGATLTVDATALLA